MFGRIILPFTKEWQNANLSAVLNRLRFFGAGLLNGTPFEGAEQVGITWRLDSVHLSQELKILNTCVNDQRSDFVLQW